MATSTYIGQFSTSSSALNLCESRLSKASTFYIAIIKINLLLLFTALI